MGDILVLLKDDSGITVMKIYYNESSEHYILSGVSDYWNPNICNVETFISNHKDKITYNDDIEEDDNVVAMLYRCKDCFEAIDFALLKQYFNESTNTFDTPENLNLKKKVLYCGFYKE